ncbi:hypothetical protein BDA99DRAFT_542720 [Phascolomyces articulosus]|uniref:Uncharacterized protein n=1 Tax=Phascolomyces articulosus TaxID=60185 RepID=A0AAD5PA43_9FUNG|nr:hypothetical protein BDA99DRAFT_542720 [Phascolomyces articulosus]
MSVLSAVAFLNTSEERLDQQQRGRSPSPTSASINNNNKPTTEAAIKELNRIRTGGGNGVASLLSKFGNDTTVARPPPPPSPRSPLSPTTSTPATAILRTNDRPTLRSPTTTTTITPATETTTPISKPKPLTTTTAKNGLTRTQVDMLSQELTTLYQESVKKAEAAEQELEQLKEQIGTYEADSTKVRDYEIRVEYLAQKLEQVSEERDGLEQELRMYRERQGNLDTPISPVFQHRLSGIFNQQDKQPQQESEQQHHENEYDDHDHDEDHSEFMHNILDAYEEDEDENSSFGIQSERPTEDGEIRGTIRYSNNNNNSNAPPEEQIAFLTEQLRAADEGTKIAVQHYLSELEQERLRTKTLQQVLKKQEDLITTLESKLVSTPNTKLAPRPPRNASLASPTLETSSQNNSLERALRDQVESQRVELEDKRALLTQLLNEREDMLKKVKLGASRPGASSFDILAELARPPTTSGSNYNQQKQYLPYQRQQQNPIVDGRNTPPPTAPPRDPLPPVPPTATSTSSPSKSSARDSISSYHEESIVSSVTSWSSSTGADYYGRQQHQQKKEQSPTSHNNFEAMYSNYLKDDMFEEEHDPYLEALRRLEGPDSTTTKNNNTTWNPNNMTAH